MTTPLFEQFISLLAGTQENEGYTECTNYQVLADFIFTSIDNEIKYYVIRFDQTINMFYQLFQNRQSQGASLSVCSNIFEIFVIMVQKRPSLITNNPNRLLNLVQKLFEMFNMLDFQFDEPWTKPYEGYVEEQDFSEQSTLTKQIMSFFDRIAMSYSYTKFIQFFNGVLPGWFNSSDNDWKSRYTLIMIMSQLGEDIEYPLMIKNYVECGISSINHPHPKVRFAVLQMFGQLSDDMKPEFQQTYGQQVLPIILTCAKDQVPRVQGHAMACLTNFLEDFQNGNFHLVEPYINQIISISQNFAYNGMSVLKQNTVSALASLATINLLKTEQVQKILSIINHLLTCELHQKPEYNQLINQTIECLSMVLYAQDKQKVQKYLSQSVNVIKSLRTRVTATYFVNAWSRICLKYQNFTDLSDVLLPILVQVTSMIQSYESELQSAITAVLNTITSFKGNVKPYANEIIQFCKNGISKLQTQTKEKQHLYEILNELVKNLKNQAPDPQWEETSRQIFSFFYEEVQSVLNQEGQEDDYSNLQPAMKGLQANIEHINNLFTPDSVNIFSQKVLSIAERIGVLLNQSKQELYQFKNTQSLTQDQFDKQQFREAILMAQENLAKIYAARLIVPDIFQSIFKVVSFDIKMNIAQGLYPHISMYLLNTQPAEDIRYGLYFLCNFLDELKYEGIQEYANVYEEKFTQFTLNSNIQVRNCAVYGLGVFMKLIPVEKTNEAMIYKWLNILWNSLSLSFENDMKKKLFNFARDNIVSALGKLIYSKRTFYPFALNAQVHQKWFQNLPLNYDKIEGNEQQQILLRLLEESPESLIDKKQDIYQVLTIFAKYLLKRANKTQEQFLSNKKATRQYVFKMKNWLIFQENSEFLWKNLAQNHKTILTQLMS